MHDENLIIRFSARAPKELKLETARALAAIMHWDVKGAGERRASGGVHMASGGLLRHGLLSSHCGGEATTERY